MFGASQRDSPNTDPHLGPQLWHIRDKREALSEQRGNVGAILPQLLRPFPPAPPYSEIFNQLVPSIEVTLKRGGVMRSIDRVSGGFLVILFGGVALLCGSLLFATLG